MHFKSCFFNNKKKTIESKKAHQIYYLKIHDKYLKKNYKKSKLFHLSE